MITVNGKSYKKWNGYFKTVEIKDVDGNKLTRKVRRDENGLYVICHGMKGRLAKTIRTMEIKEGLTTIIVVRKVSYYE